ncbi:hypothetical protein [Priestia abyssalis]|uniref:hypothetical protein n=1 Tax=Priestia abyssalis TaxID=1221450 RepID=UPI000994C1D6|nr:hypothetical protein [Priestia abyssalis]
MSTQNKQKNDFPPQGKLIKGIAALALGTIITGGFLSFHQAEAQEANDNVLATQESTKDVVGIVTKHVDNDSIEFNVEGDVSIYRCNGELTCQEEINNFKLGSGLLIQFSETKDHQFIIKNMEALYEPETDEVEKVIEADYQSMVNGQEVKVYINNQPKILPLQEYLQDQDYDSQFSPGTKVTLLVREDMEGNMTVGAINEL